MNAATDNFPLRVLDLFCGIGGCSTALAGRADVVAAIDINQRALQVYQSNHRHAVETKTMESIPADQLAAWHADLWWMSPPCQPYTRRGRQRDVHDPRAAAFLVLLQRIEEVQPPYVALENVAAFQSSRACHQLRHSLEHCGYSFQEAIWCSTQFGLPNRRPRFYLVASRKEKPRWRPPKVVRRHLSELLDQQASADLYLSRVLFDRYGSAMHLVDPSDPLAVTNCFTSAYGRSPVQSGSYLSTASGGRLFSPREILRLLGYPDNFELPAFLTRAQAYRLIGNSLSIPVVRHVLSAIEPLGC